MAVVSQYPKTTEAYGNQFWSQMNKIERERRANELRQQRKERIVKRNTAPTGAQQR